MRTQIVYVLVFDDTNYYFEQALVSACSARMHNPSANILVVTDKESECLIVGWRKEICRYVSSVVGVEVPHELNKMQRSRWLKTNLRNLIDGDYLFIDTDTVICRPLDDIDRVEGDICAVADLHGTALQSFSGYLLSNFRRAGCPIVDDFVYFNSGIMLVRDNVETRSFYQDWHRCWNETFQKGVFIDQVALRMADVKNDGFITELSGEWNCQIEGKFLNYLHSAYILHYFAYSKQHASASFYLKQEEVYEGVRQNRQITDDIREHLERPYSMFTSHYEVLMGNALACYYKFKPFFVLEGSPRRFKLFKKIARLLIPK